MPCAHFLDLLNHLVHVFAFAGAHVNKADAHIVHVVNRLSYSAQAEWQSMQPKNGFYTDVNAHREALVGAYVAAARAEITDSSGHTGPNFNQINLRRSIHFLSDLLATVACRKLRCGGAGALAKFRSGYGGAQSAGPWLPLGAFAFPSRRLLFLQQ